MLSILLRRVASHIGSLLQSKNQKKIQTAYDPKSTYWKERLRLLGSAYDSTKVKHIDYFNLKYMLVFYRDLLCYYTVQLLKESVIRRKS